MTSIYEITDLAHLASFFVWTLAVCALAKAIFGSFLAAELQHRLALRDAPKRQRMTRLNWELTNRVRYDADVARGSPHAARQPLGDDEVEAKRRELQQLARTSFAWRAFTYFMGCFACQTFWTAVGIFALTHGLADPSSYLLSAAAYSAASVTLGPLQRIGPRVTANASDRSPPCKSCGK